MNENKEKFNMTSILIVLMFMALLLSGLINSYYTVRNNGDIKFLHSSIMSFQDHVLKLKGSNPPAITVGRSDKVDIITTSSKIYVQLEAKKLFPDDEEEEKDLEKKAKSSKEEKSNGKRNKKDNK